MGIINMLACNTMILACAGFLSLSNIEPSRADDMAYFKDPKQAVETITAMLVSKDWKELSSYYDLSGTNINKDSLISGDFFIRKKRPEVVHPAAEFWRIKQPFSPEFTHQWHQTLSNGIVEVTVGIEIDQGGGMIQRGLDTFQLRKSPNGYQLLPEIGSPESSERDKALKEVHEAKALDE